ncbi:MAG: VacB/RNase II family 3'-5' exoribonuclease, partial [Bacillota bacterium]
EGSPLDRDALERGTSVYLADRVIPMLPVELSNGICSLNPDVDRLTLSCFMEIDSAGRVLRHRLAETVIRSKYRLVYEDITRLLQGDAAMQKKYAEIVPMLKELETLCGVLNARRVKRGSIDFDLAEANIRLDATGRPIDVEKAERGIANRIIEECMLIANETVAQHMYDLKSPFLYRVHETPDKEKLSELNAFLQTLGYGIRNLREVQPRAIQKVLDMAHGTQEENIVSKVVLRSMQKARYSEQCLGHFGLAATRYCHFTSPIRRYPDLMGHRIIKLMLHGELNEKQVKRLNDRLPDIAEHCSRRERVAMEAERAVDELKKCEYMKERIGDSFAGVISGVVSFGFFVELGNTVEGLVRASSLDDDYYAFDEKGYRMVGRSHGQVYRLGDTVQIRVAAVHMDSRNIDFELDRG